MNIFNSSAFRRWLSERSRRSQAMARRRRRHRQGVAREFPPVVGEVVQELEDRVVLDATVNFREFKLIALGASAKFETRAITARPENFSSLGNVNDGRFPLQSQGTSIVTTSKVEVWHVAGNQRLFVLPEGGEFREFDWNPSYLANFSGQTTGPDGKTPKYADIVPRFGLVSVDNGQTSQSQTSIQQKLELSGELSSFLANYTLSWNGETTGVITAPGNAQDIANALNSLPKVRASGGSVSVVGNADNNNGRAIFTVTFAGVSTKPPLISVQTGNPFVARGNVTPITQINVTNSDRNADLNGRGLIMPLTGIRALSSATAGTPSSVYLSKTLPKFLSTNVDYWAIPEDRATSFPADTASVFTPSHMGAYKLDDRGRSPSPAFEPRLVGRFAYAAYDASFYDVNNPASRQLGFHNSTDPNTSGMRVTAGPDGFKISGAAIEIFGTLPIDKDSKGVERRKAFRFGGLNFELQNTPPFAVRYDGREVNLAPDSEVLIGKAQIPGGSLTLKFFNARMNVQNNKITAGSLALDSLELGGYRFTPHGGFATNGLLMNYDAAAERFTFTPSINEGNEDPRKNAATFVPGSATGANSVNLSIIGGSIVITRGLIDEASRLNIRTAQIVRRVSVNGRVTESTQMVTAAGGGLFARFHRTPKLNDDRDKTVRIPANSFAIFGEGRMPLDIGGLTISDTVNFGDENSSQFLISNSQHTGIRFGLKEVVFGGTKWAPDTAGSAVPMTGSLNILTGTESQPFTFRGGARLVSGSPSLAPGMKVNFGGGGTSAVQAFFGENRLTVGGNVEGSFTAGTSRISASAGLTGMKVELGPTTNGLIMTGTGVMDVNGFDATLDDNVTKLESGRRLNPWDSMKSPNGRFMLRLEAREFAPGIYGTARLFVRDTKNGDREVWAGEDPNNKPPRDTLEMNADGNLVFYTIERRTGTTLLTHPVSNTGGNRGAYLALFNDGNLAVISAGGDRILWETNVHIDTQPRVGGVRVSASDPKGVTNPQPNRLDGETMRFHIDERLSKLSLGGMVMYPLATPNGLRVQTRAGASEFVGDFSTSISGRNLFASMNPIAMSNGAIPGSGVTLDFTRLQNVSSDWVAGGIVMTGLNTAVLSDNNTKVVLNLTKSTFENKVIAEGSVGAEPNRFEIVRGRISSAVINSPGAQKIGDFDFSRFDARYDFNATPSAWVFNGPAKFFGRDMNVGGSGDKDPKLVIGGVPSNPKLGPQLQSTNLPYDIGPLTFPLPAVFAQQGVNFEMSKFTQDGVDSETENGRPKSKTYRLSTRDYVMNVGRTSITFSGSMKVKVFENPDVPGTAKSEISSLNVDIKQNTPITIGNATLQVKALKLVYDVGDRQFEISGNASFQYRAGRNMAQMEVTLGDEQNPGLTIRDGAVQQLLMKVDGEFQLLKLNIKAQGLTVEYKREEQSYAIYGDVILNTVQQGKTQVIRDMRLSIGAGSDRPGIVIAGGSLKSIDMSLNGDINLFGITASPEDLRVRYTSDGNLLQLTGGVRVTLANRMVLKAVLPGEGILINTETGEVQVRGVHLSAEGDIRFGALTIKNLEAFFEDDGQGNISFGAGATVAMPSGLEVGASFKILNGKLDAISVKFQRNPGILVAQGIVNIYSIEGSIEGLSDLDNFKLSATVKATVGPKVAFAGQSFALADVTGTITVTKNDLTIEGDVQLVGGLFGNGSFKGVLTWSDTARVQFNASIRLYPGDIIQGDLSAYIDINGNVDFNASIGVYVPSQIPVAGGWNLGKLTIELRVRPQEPAANSYVRFGVRILNVSGGIKASFDANVHFDLEIDFFFFSLSKSGDFSLRNIGDRPDVRIVSASSVANSPDGRIVFRAEAGELAGAIIDLYADTDAAGHDGLLIGSSIPLAAGDQTFVWEDMTTLTKPGQPVYVYAVVRDRQDQKAYSDYSLPFTASSGFVPTITAPATQAFFAGREMIFSVAGSNAIVIDDPRRRQYADAEVLVALDAGSGSLDFPAPPTGVTVDGAGTRHVTLRGRGDRINAALNGLRYIARDNTMFDDTLTISVNSLPQEHLDNTVRKVVELSLHSLALSTLSDPDSSAVEPVDILAGEGEYFPLDEISIDSQRSDWLTGARVQITNFVSGSDVLDLPYNSELETGISAEFDCETGVLVLSGFRSMEDYEWALQNVVFSTKTVASGKSLILSVLDEDGERGELTVPLNIADQHDAPDIGFTDSGILVTRDQEATFVTPSAELQIHDGQFVTRVEFAFLPDGYVPGEDFLGYDLDETPSGENQPIYDFGFNAETGVLTLTGGGTAAQWQDAIRHVWYESRGEGFTTGTRYLMVTVFDSFSDNNSASVVQVIEKREQHETVTSPVLAPSVELLSLAASDEYVVIDDGLTVTADLPKLIEARVRITEGHIAGEQALAAGSLGEGLTADFDEHSGELVIRGIASVDVYENVLRSVVFLNTAADREGHDLSVEFTVSDGLTEMASAGLSIHIADAPHLDTQLGNVLIYEDGRQSLVIDTGMAIDFEGNLTGATVTFVGGLARDEDRLVFTNQHGITGVYRAFTGVLELTGTATAEEYAEAIKSIRYANTRYNPSAGDRIIEYQVRSGAASSNTIQALISVEPNLLSPQISMGGGTTVFQEDGAAVRIAPNFDLTAMDATDTFASAPQLLHGVEIAVLNYAVGEDVLSFADTAAINGEWNADEGILFLYGDATFAEYEAAVRSVTFWNSSDAPESAARQIRISLLDNGENGLARNAVTTQVVRSVGDRPVRSSGDSKPVYVVQNGEISDLGLGDLHYVAPASFTETDIKPVVRVTEVPNELLGTILNAAGEVVSVGDQFPVSELAALRFETELGGIGTGFFRFEVHLCDPDSGRLDEAFVAETLGIVVTGVTTSTSSEAFIAQVFRDLTGRDATPETVKNWASVLDQQLRAAALRSGDVDPARATVVDWITRSNTVRNAWVQEAYRTLLDRLPTNSELAAGIALLSSGQTIDALKLAIATSEEYFTLNGAENQSYVAAMFEELRGEDGSAEEIDRWIAALDRGDTWLVVATGIADLDDAVDRHASALFRQMLNREPAFDDDETFKFDNLTSLTKQVLSSDEYFGRNAVPTTTRPTRTQPTTGYSAVGKLGDAGGDKAGATLIAPQYVLAAAHSVADLPPGQLTFTLGGVIHHVTKVWVHPDYDAEHAGTEFGHDIAILKLAQPVTGVTPAVLSSIGVKEGDVLNLVGFGEHEGAEFGTKRVGAAPAVEEVGQTTFRWTVHSAWENDSDPGDSGSPLFLRDKGTEYLAGIVSGGINVEDGFGDTSVNTRVDVYLDWIRSITGTQSASALSVTTTTAKRPEGSSGSTPMTFTVTRTGRTDLAASVAWGVVVKGDDAADAADFGGSLPSGTVQFAAGESSRTITVQIAGDTGWEADEQFFVSLWSPSAGTQISVAYVQATIPNDDSLRDLTYASAELPIDVRVLGSGWLEVRIGGVVQAAVNPVNVRSLVVQGSAQSDQLNLTGLRKSVYPNLQRIELSGNAGQDSITGSDEFSETISGGRGNDALHGGRGGNDRLSEMPPAGFVGGLQVSLSNTRMTGSLGTDTLSGFEETVLSGTSADDILNASGFGRPAFLYGLAGNDLLVGGTGDDMLFGGIGNDQLNGGQGNDILNGGEGDDLLNSGDGHNVLIGGYGKDRLNGGGGEDLLLGGALTGQAGTSAGLAAIRVEWLSNKSVSARRAALKAGVGTGGAVRISSQTVLNDRETDELRGGSDKDWFVSSSGDTLFDQHQTLGDLLDVL